MWQPAVRRMGAPAHRRAASFGIVASASLIVVVVLVGLLAWLSRATNHPTMNEPLLVYCAMSVQPALRPVAEAYERATGIPVSIQVGSSGSLESQIRLSGKGDVFIPAAEAPYLDRGRTTGLVSEIVRLAEFQLVLALRPGVSPDGVSLQEIASGRLRCAIANEEAAAGHATRIALQNAGQWNEVRRAARVFLPTVTAVAQAVQQGTAVDVGFVWNTTARQFGLRIVELPNLAAGRATVSAGVLSCSGDLVAAHDFVSFLAAPKQGGAIFRELGYAAPKDDRPH